MYKILVIDDDVEICRIIENALSKCGYDIEVKNEASGIEAKDFKPYDLILLDVMMPKVDGFSLCRSIRKDVDCPIIFLTAKSLEEDLVEGFSLGADDYIKKPFSIAELRARVGAHLRREHREHHQRIVNGNFKFDLSEKQLYINEEKITLTKSEYKICEFLVRHINQVFSLEQIIENVFGYDFESDTSAIREHIKNIRAKFAKYDEKPIETVWGIGYKWI